MDQNRQTQGAERDIDQDELLKRMAGCIDDIQSLRKQDPEHLPSQIWESLFRMTNICPTFEVVIAVYAHDKPRDQFIGWALKRREYDDPNWANLYHAPGTVLRYRDTSQTVHERLAEEIFSKQTALRYSELPHIIREDGVRESTCLSIIYLLNIRESNIPSLIGDWKIFSHDMILRGDKDVITDQIPLFVRAYTYINTHA